MRTTLLSGIYARLAANPDDPFVLALGGVDDGGGKLRYWPWGAEQGGKYPYAVAYIVSDVDVGAITDDISEFEWQMMIYTKTVSEGNQLAVSCNQLFNRQSLASGDSCFTCMYGATISPLREADTDPFQTTVTFSCYLQQE